MAKKISNIELEQKLREGGEYIPSWKSDVIPEVDLDKALCDEFGYVTVKIDCGYCDAIGINARGRGKCVMCNGSGILKTVRTKCAGCINCKNK